MPKKTHGLGRGLDSLFAGAEDWGTSIQEIPVGELDPNPDQPRRTFSPESISQLADSIREQGVLQPLLVAPAGGGRYMIIAGERRYRAGREAGLETLPCIVKDIDVIRQREIALIENLKAGSDVKGKSPYLNEKICQEGIVVIEGGLRIKDNAVIPANCQVDKDIRVPAKDNVIEEIFRV